MGEDAADATFGRGASKDPSCRISIKWLRKGDSEATNFGLKSARNQLAPLLLSCERSQFYQINLHKLILNPQLIPRDNIGALPMMKSKTTMRTTKTKKSRNDEWEWKWEWNSKGKQLHNPPETSEDNEILGVGPGNGNCDFCDSCCWLTKNGIEKFFDHLTARLSVHPPISIFFSIKS